MSPSTCGITVGILVDSAMVRQDNHGGCSLLIFVEFLEFDFRVVGDGRSATARYANNSNYRNDALIRKESKHLGCQRQSTVIDRTQCASAP